MKLKTSLLEINFFIQNKLLLKITSEESGMQTETLLQHDLIFFPKESLLAKYD